MSKNMLTIATVICIAALAVCGAWILGRTVFDGMRYPDAERYTAGGTTLNDDVKSLEIDWTDGSVTIARHAANTVEVSETAPGAISADAALRWWLDGDTLRIQYAKSGFFTFRSLNKALTVTLPEGLELENVDIDVTSGDVNAPDLRADDIRVDLTSGDLALSQSGSTQSMALSSTSGNISVSAGEVGSLSVSGTSANMRIAAERTEALKASTTSGTIFVEGGEAGKVDVNTTSGAVDVSLSAFSDLTIDVTSGNIAAALPSEPGYRADVSTTSGKFDYTVPLTRDGDGYTCGDGSGSVRIHATSGDIRLADTGE